MAAPLLLSQTANGSKNFKSGNYKLSLIPQITREWVDATLVSLINVMMKIVHMMDQQITSNIVTPSTICSL